MRLAFGGRAVGALVVLFLGGLIAAGAAPGERAFEQTGTEPGSLGEARIYHLAFASDVDASSGIPINQGDQFEAGSKLVVGLLGWDFVPAGTALRLQLFFEDRLIFEDNRTVVNARDSGVVFPFFVNDGLPAGVYTAQLDYNGVPEEVASFTIGAGAALGGTTTGSGMVSGPIPYKDPAEVLVVTRAATLRTNMGAEADAVLAAAARVGELHDLDEGGTVIDTPEKAIAEVKRLLGGGKFKYLLLLGNDDAVPFAHVENPLGKDEEEALQGSELPADWLPSDDPYADLDGDEWGMPDLPTARIPSSEDAELLLTQLSDLTPPDGGGFAFVNQKRRGQANPIIGVLDTNVAVETQFSPPTTAERFNTGPGGSSRYLYVLMHGDGVQTNAWLADIVAWKPRDPEHLTDGEWEVAVGDQVNAVQVDGNPGSRGVVFVGACYGAWTLDTVLEPKHKTAENSLALYYLKLGTRAFVADTHLSYSVLIPPGGAPVGRSGFELVFWSGINGGLAPIDAFYEAKKAIAQVIDLAVDAGRPEIAALNLKTIHYMIYLGRP